MIYWDLWIHRDIDDFILHNVNFERNDLYLFYDVRESIKWIKILITCAITVLITYTYLQCHRNHGFCSNSSGLDIPSSPNSMATPGSPSTPGSFTSDLYSYSSTASNSTNTPSSPTSRLSFQYPGSSSSPIDSSYFGRPIRGCSTPYR